ncbi:M16 family metallopeptidase [Candidatus Kryptobacter tengchongensis]|uniref:M16 family metallopeptidase n=1 Tax=Kryptobacter tengchongensis TaxID=1643429 RepID=UPI0007078998|nr:pitrilysin family protein [Candidatus Kryptobacter tengchongensis]CUS89448.1 Predicted Zn-dependent peptidase [Candidatus Kryptobacter tengchongensis]
MKILKLNVFLFMLNVFLKPVELFPQSEGKIDFVEFTLENGLHVILHEDHSTPIVAVNVCYHVGSKNEKPDKTGFAHLFEHLMFDGSKNVKRGEFDKYISQAGGYDNAYTTEDKTNYYEVLPSNYLELALWLESDRMLEFSIQEISLITQREVVKEERRWRYENRPYGSAWIKISEKSFKKHPYRWPVIGYQEHLDKASMDDVKEFYETFYVPNNAVLVIAGDIDIERTKKLVEKYFADIPKGPDNIPHPSPEDEPLENEIREVVEDINAPLPAVFMSYRIPEEGNPDSYALALLSNILSVGESSRLYQRLVYKDKIANEVETYSDSREHPGLFLIYAIANPGFSSDTLEKVIDEEIDKIKNYGVEEKELEKAKNKIESALVSARQTVQGKADLLAHYYTFYKNPALVNREIDKYRSVTVEDIKRVAQVYLDSKRRVILHYLPKVN